MRRHQKSLSQGELFSMPSTSTNIRDRQNSNQVFFGTRIDLQQLNLLNEEPSLMRKESNTIKIRSMSRNNLDDGAMTHRSFGSNLQSNNTERRNTTRMLKKGVVPDTDHKRLRNILQQVIYNNLINVRHANKQTVLEMFNALCEHIQTSIKAKNERFVLNLMHRFSCYNSRITDFLNQFNPKPSTWTGENLLKTMIQQQAEGWSKISQMDGFKKFKLDPMMLDAVQEITRRLEDNLLNLQDDRYHDFANALVSRNYQVNIKRTKVKKQLIDGKRIQLNHIEEMMASKSNMNLRILETNISQRLFQNEKKYGKFNLISNLTRNASIGIDGVVNEMKTNPLLQD